VDMYIIHIFDNDNNILLHNYILKLVD